MVDHLTPLADWLVIAPVVVCLIGGALLMVTRRFVAIQPWLCLLVVLAMIVNDGALLSRVLATGPVSMTMGRWLPPFGISFTADALGVGFAVTAAAVTFAIVLNLMTESTESAARDGLYPLVLLLLAGVQGAFLTGDLFNLYVWFEVTLIASFGLIVLAGKPLQIDGAVKYGIVNFLATTLFLAGLGLLYAQLGTLNMADMIGAASRADPLPLTATAGLLTLAFAVKAAAFPVNSWLPASYHTPPASISALMGAILTKVGLYALLRVLIMLLPAQRQALSVPIEVIAIVTMLAGPLAALVESNLRRSIGFLLIGGVGAVLAAIPGAGHAALSGAAAYVVHSMLTLGGLYALSGTIERMTGQTDTHEMGGLASASWLVSFVFFVLVMSQAGVPPFLGFWPKLLLLQGFISASDWPLVFALLASSLLTLIVGIRLWARIFWYPTAHSIGKPAALAAPILLGGTTLLLGLSPSLLINVSEAAARDLAAPASYITATGLLP